MTARLQSLLIVGCLLVAALYAPENLALLHPTAQLTELPAQPSGSSAMPSGSWGQRPGPSERPPAVHAAATKIRPAVRRRPAVALAGWRRADEVRIASRPVPPEEELAGE